MIKEREGGRERRREGGLRGRERGEIEREGRLGGRERGEIEKEGD